MLKEWKGYKRGLNLGGWLSQCNHTKERYEQFITEEDFKIFGAWGLDHVRIPIDYNLFEDKDGNYVESGFAYIQRAIDWCEKYHLNMILDIHKTYGFSFDDGEQECGFFENEAYQERFYRMWEELAKRYAKYENRLAFELLNEVTSPSYGPTWNRIASTCIARIRAIAPTIKIMVGGYWNNSAAAVKDLELPDDANLIYNFHCYEPLAFTHQGAFWVKEMPADFRVSMKMTCKEIQEHLKKTINIWYDQLNIAPDINKCVDKDFFIAAFAEAVSVAEKKGVPLYCGEYGVIEQADPEEEVLWYEGIHAAFEHYGIGRATWSYKEMNFGLVDARLDGVREELLKLL